MKKEEFEQTLQNEPVLILDIREAEEIWKDSSIPNTQQWVKYSPKR